MSARKFGAAFDSSAYDAKMELLESIYRKLGANPDNITVAE